MVEDGALALILVTANFTGQEFGEFCRHFLDPKMGGKTGICWDF